MEKNHLILIFHSDLNKYTVEAVLKAKTKIKFNSYFIHQIEKIDLDSKKVLLEIPCSTKKAQETFKHLRDNNCRTLALAAFQAKEIEEYFWPELGPDNVIQTPVDNNVLVERIAEFMQN